MDKKRLISVILIVLVAFSLVCCGSDDMPGPTDSTTQAETESAAELIAVTESPVPVETADTDNVTITLVDYIVTRRINSEMPDFDFRIKGSIHYVTDIFGNERGIGSIYEFTISSRDGSFFQEIPISVEKSDYFYEREMYGLSFDDWNFDGCLDVRLRCYMGGSMGNEPAYYWLWDNEAGKYIENKQLEDISEYSWMRIDYEMERVLSFMKVYRIESVASSGAKISYYEYTAGMYRPVKRVTNYTDPTTWSQSSGKLWVSNIIIEEPDGVDWTVAEDFVAVFFGDTEYEGEIREILGKPNGNITVEDMISIGIFDEDFRDTNYVKN